MVAANQVEVLALARLDSGEQLVDGVGVGVRVEAVTNDPDLAAIVEGAADVADNRGVVFLGRFERSARHLEEFGAASEMGVGDVSMGGRHGDLLSLETG